MDSLKEFKSLISMIGNQHNSKVKELVSNRGREFISKEFSEFTASRGIVHAFLPPYTLEHSGYAEHANCTIIDKARCMLLQSCLPKSYWAEAINSAVFVSNMLPTASWFNISPYQLWTNLYPPLSCLKYFGYLASTAIQKTHCSWKFGQTGEMGVFVGYEKDGTTFHIICLSNNKLIPTRHARFSEFEFSVLSALTPLAPSEDEDLEFDNISFLIVYLQPSKPMKMNPLLPLQLNSILEKCQPEAPPLVLLLPLPSPHLRHALRER